MAMAPSAALKRWCLLIAAFLSAGSCCCQAQNAVAIVARAILCFDNMTIYRNCLSQYRLTANGTLDVPSNATNFFCNGPCMAETQLVLGCVDGILSNFQFYNGATIQAVSSTLLIACGNTSRRGDFNVSENIMAAAGNHVKGQTSSNLHVQDSGRQSFWAISLGILLTVVVVM